MYGERAAGQPSHGRGLRDAGRHRRRVRPVRRHERRSSRPGRSPVSAPSTDRRAAVDDDVLDAGRVARRIGVGRLVGDGRRVEDDEVGEGALADDAAIAQPEPSSRHGR